MHGKPPQIPAIFFAPDREMSLRAVSLTLLKIRSIEGMTCDKLAKVLGCSPDTIRAASNEQNMLSFDHVAALLFHFPDECAPIIALWQGAPSAPTLPDRLERIERELAAIRRETAA